MSNEGDPKACKECGVDKSFFQKQIRRLREKLDHSQLQIHSLERECERLRDELGEAKWGGFSTVRSRPAPPTFPTEILRTIFGHATSMNGLAFAHWHNRTRKDSWATTSFTRRSIPLVCKSWYAIGTEFLYRHVVLFTSRQAKALNRTLFGPYNPLGRIGMESIRAMELLFEISPIEQDEDDYISYSQSILLKLPRDQLRLFSVEEMHYQHPKDVIQNIVVQVLNQHHGSLETLELPSVAHTRHWQALSKSTLRADKLTLSRLHTLSIANECWWYVSSNGTTEFLSKINYPCLRELSIEWNRSSPNNFLPLIQLLQQNLRSLHVIDYTNTTMHHLGSILDWLPCLEHLSVFYNSQFGGGREPRDVVVTSNKHLSLKEVVIWMKTTVGYKSILSIGPLFTLLKLGQLPSLHLIKICGLFPGGCVDTDLIMPQRHVKAWRDAVKLCKKRRIILVNTSGDPMHVWSMKHGIKWKDEDSESESDSSTSDSSPNSSQDRAEENEDVISSSDEETEEESNSDDDEWAEVETDTSFQASEISSLGIISDDSEDTPYRYVRQFDVDFASSDLDESDE